MQIYSKVENTFRVDITMRKNRFIRYFLLSALSLLLPQCSQGLSIPIDTNKLGTSANPTLRFYANSPVSWQEWSEETLQKAHSENKLLFISIGFASCHWCHVMEKETFSDTVLSNYLNEHFLCIRVDKEELPQIDQIYQEFAALTDQNTGWPMNVIATNTGTPVYSRTFMKADELIGQLKHFYEFNQNQKIDLTNYAEAVENILHTTQEPIADAHAAYPDISIIQNKLDWVEGGVLQSNKFLLSPFLRYTLTSNDTLLNQHALLSINKILSGGIYDHVDGGVHRYTTDENWHFPHWEKTLSDNSQFISNLCEAYKLTQHELYLEKAIEISQFIFDNLSLSNGLYANSLDSESSGKEGSYYVWTYSELESLLGEHFKEFCRVFAVSENGNYTQNENVLYKISTVNPAVYDQNPTIELCLHELRKARQKRVPPQADDKATVAYNAMFMQACIDLYTISKNDDYLYHAYAIMENIESAAKSMPSALPHSIVDMTALSEGVLEDYALYIKSLISLYQIHCSETLLLRAKEYADYTCLHFTYQNSIWFQLSKNDQSHIFNLINKSDDDSPSANAVMAENLFTLGRYFEDETRTDRSINLSLLMGEQTYNHPVEHGSWSYFHSILSAPECDIVFNGERALGLALEFRRKYKGFATLSFTSPETLIPLAKNKYSEKENLIYVCMNRTCERPVKTVEEAIQMIESLRQKKQP
jgi:hypothetical protein